MSQMPRGWQAESAMRPGLDLAIGLAVAVSVVYDHQHINNYTHSTERAQCDPTIEWGVSEECQKTDNADGLLALARQRTIPV
jgi:hypothetical protein